MFPVAVVKIFLFHFADIFSSATTQLFRLGHPVQLVDSFTPTLSVYSQNYSFPPCHHSNDRRWTLFPFLGQPVLSPILALEFYIFNFRIN